jgi:hypothetical protein
MSKAKAKHPLVIDGWLSDDEPEFSMVHSARIADVSRAADGVKTIARLVHNSLGEPEATGAQPLGIETELSLLGALECLGGYIFDQMEDMRETASMHAKFQRDSGGSHAKA